MGDALNHAGVSTSHHRPPALWRAAPLTTRAIPGASSNACCPLIVLLLPYVGGTAGPGACCRLGHMGLLNIQVCFLWPASENTDVLGHNQALRERCSLFNSRTLTAHGGNNVWKGLIEVLFQEAHFNFPTPACLNTWKEEHLSPSLPPYVEVGEAFF